MPICKICQSPTEILLEGLFDDRYGYPGTYAVRRCRQCGFGQLDPEPSEADLQAIYTSHYPRHNLTAKDVKACATFHGRPQEWLKVYVDGTTHSAHYYVKPGEKVLDVGCGAGFSLLEIQSMGGEAYGTEYDRNVEPVAKELGLKIHFGPLETAPWPDHFFDVVTMSQLLEHVPNPIQFLQQAKVKLKPGGRIVFSSPNLESFNYRHTGAKWINWHVPYHLNFFTYNSIQRLATAAGLRLQSARTMTPLLWMSAQYDSNSYTPTVGEVSPVWNGKLPRPQWFHQRRMAHLAMMAPYYKVMDVLKRGDSWLVTLCV